MIFVLLMLGYGVIALIYIIFWLIIPKAETYEQKLEMKGENITISNIEEKVKKEYNEVRDNFNQYRKSEEYRNISSRFSEILSVLGNIILGFIKFIAILAGVGLILAGIVLSFSFLGVTLYDFPSDWVNVLNEDHFPVILFFNSVFDPVSIFIFASSIGLLALIPILILIYLVFRLIGFRGSDRLVFSSGIILWIIAFIAVIGVSLFQFRDFAFSASTQNSESVPVEKSEALYISVQEKDVPDYYIDEFHFDSDENSLYGIDKAGNIYLIPKLSIKKSHSDEVEIRMKKISKGKSYENAAKKAEKINYQYTVNHSEIQFNSHFIIPHEDQFRLQQVVVTLFVPEGKQIHISENLEEYLEYVKNDKGYWKDDMGDKTWVMGEDRLKLVEPVKLN